MDAIDASFGDWVLRPLLFSALVLLAFLPLEHAFALHVQRRTPQSIVKDLLFASAGQVLVRIGNALLLGFALGALEPHGLSTPLWASVASPRTRALLDIGSGVLLLELGGYAYHRAAHAVPALWRMHRVHHSSEQMDALAAFRQHPLEIVLMTLVQNAPLVLLGIPLGTHAGVLLFLKLYTVFVHANLRVPHGPWGELLALPAFHHRHHQESLAPRNFASLLPVLDRLFGTHEAMAAVSSRAESAGPHAEHLRAAADP